ncbi:MAG: hypothetical protein JNJ40_02740 [Bacteroidia bacterium]|nr:hypothetical protein [Bacteroidia bacterium]
MKKIFLPLLVVAASLSITSCHKERTCTCTTTSTVAGTSTTTTSVDSWSHATKHEAAAACVSKKWTSTFGTVSVENVDDCKLD